MDYENFDSYEKVRAGGSITSRSALCRRIWAILETAPTLVLSVAALSFKCRAFQQDLGSVSDVASTL